MFVPATFAAALLMTIISTTCWRSFANTFKLTHNYCFELYYWDYAFGIFLISLLLAFTMGSLSGGDTAFLANVHSAGASNLWYAAIGGFIFNIANVLLLAGIDIVPDLQSPFRSRSELGWSKAWRSATHCSRRECRTPAKKSASPHRFEPRILLLPRILRFLVLTWCSGVQLGPTLLVPKFQNRTNWSKIDVGPRFSSQLCSP
ncbi:MAG: hypothetical protein JOZ10_19165 [Acidobacteria bacterium]|nr:hypothetical protein [Acidobacteriota bacterium]MBV9144425.1 hypothetical protein [Acidobacteriota bacterium]MBV9437105.1 hypothetical protein [Acidobacteriota bacterium]